MNAFRALQVVGESDTTPPAAVANLRVNSQNGRAINLAFTAPGDDGNAGQAALYEISFASGTSGATSVVATAVPSPSGAVESVPVTVPLRQTSGALRVKVIDNLGNESAPASVNITIDPAAADPYTTGLSAPGGLAAVGTALNFRDDDSYRGYSLPFSFPFYGEQHTAIVISTNGTLYFQPQSTLPIIAPPEDNGDSASSVEALAGFKMIAGLWDDIRTDSTGGDVFVNTSDPNKVIFRWEGRRFATSNPNSGPPAQFEIELQRDGVIQLRYGAGNNGFTPVVGIGGGSPGSAYVIDSHTSPRPNPVINLNNAQTVTFAPRPAAPNPPNVRFDAQSVSFGEGQGTVTLNVARAGDLSIMSTVSYATVDDPAAVPCAQRGGAAYARCDYATNLDTLTFGPGEGAKTITLSLIDDAHVEDPETFQVQLSNPSAGTTLGGPSTVTVVILDNDAAGSPNPVFASREFFVRQQYLDFLSREPDGDGLNAWLRVLNSCPNVDTGPEVSSECDRIYVSGIGFFDSQEFRLKGFYVFLFYRVAFDRLAQYTEIVADMRGVTGQTPADTFARRAQFPVNFTQRQEFINLFGGMSNTQFVDTLMNRYGLQQITTPDPANPEGTVKVTLSRADLAGRLTAGTLTRAAVLRAVVQSDEVGAAERNRAFVAMQYYGYLRRTPEEPGYSANVNFLNQNPNGFREIINAFLNSQEYQLRFGRIER